MSYQKTELYFLVSLLAVMSVITFFIFEPFLYALLLALIFATVFSGVHKRVLGRIKGNHGLASLISTTFVLVVIVVPVTLLSIQIFDESTSLYSSVVENGGSAALSQATEEALRKSGVAPFLPAGSLDVSQYMKQGLSFLIQHLGTIFSNIAKILVGVFILFIALYYLFKDGHKLKKSVIALSPLSDVYDETIFSKLELAINSVAETANAG